MLYDSVNDHQNSYLQFFKLIHPSSEKVDVYQESVQNQKGSNDCGLFVLGFFTCLAFGVKSKNYLFDQRKMRKHFVDCVNSNLITLFPGEAKKIKVKGVDKKFTLNLI